MPWTAWTGTNRNTYEHCASNFPGFQPSLEWQRGESKLDRHSDSLCHLDRAMSGKTPQPPAPASSMQAIFCWNDDEEKARWIAITIAPVIPTDLLHGNIPAARPFVIPAKAGIQWFIQSISAKREWQLNVLGNVNRNKPECLQTLRQRLSWIPAFAGMTMRKKQGRSPSR